MPWLGDGTWVQDAGLARAIVHGRTNYRPWSGKMPDKVKDAQPKSQTTRPIDGQQGVDKLGK